MAHFAKHISSEIISMQFDSASKLGPAEGNIQ
jgi:hypothetical protein